MDQQQAIYRQCAIESDGAPLDAGHPSPNSTCIMGLKQLNTCIADKGLEREAQDHLHVPRIASQTTNRIESGYTKRRSGVAEINMIQQVFRL